MQTVRAGRCDGEFGRLFVGRAARPAATLFTFGLCCLAFAGCRLGAGAAAPPQASFSQQEQEILEIAPRGTKRDEALARLSSAGVKGNFGERNSIYYCDGWDRPDGRRSHLNLALLFDENGELYQVRPADALTSVETGVAGDDPVASDTPYRRTRDARVAGEAHEIATASGESSRTRKSVRGAAASSDGHEWPDRGNTTFPERRGSTETSRGASTFPPDDEGAF